jgi:hypothetical protein
MVENCEDSLIRKFDPQQNYLWLWNPSKGKSGGILVGVKLDLYEVGSFRQCEYMIQLNLWDRLAIIKWNLLIVYGATNEEGKIPFLSELSSFCSSNQEPLLIRGDFNLIRYASKKSGSGGVQRHTNLFNSLINFYELKELNMSGGLTHGPITKTHPLWRN